MTLSYHNFPWKCEEQEASACNKWFKLCVARIQLVGAWWQNVKQIIMADNKLLINETNHRFMHVLWVFNNLLAILVDL
jgi:hypothetical protein